MSTNVGAGLLTSPEMQPAPTSYHRWLANAFPHILELCRKDTTLWLRMMKVIHRENLSLAEKRAEILRTLKECRESFDNFDAPVSVAASAVAASAIVELVEEQGALTQDETQQLDSTVNAVRSLMKRKLLLKRRISDTQSSLVSTRALEKRYQDLAQKLESELGDCEEELISLVKPLRSSPVVECVTASAAPAPFSIEPSKDATSPIKKRTTTKSGIRIGSNFQADVPAECECWDFHAEMEDPISAVMGWGEDPCSTGSEERNGERLYTAAELLAQKSKLSDGCRDAVRKRKRVCSTPGCVLEEFHLGPHSEERASGLRSCEKDFKKDQRPKMELHPAIYKEQLVSKRVSLYWTAPHDEWYSGIVHSYNPHNDTHFVRYDDGDDVYECLNDPTQNWKIGWPPKPKPSSPD